MDIPIANMSALQMSSSSSAFSPVQASASSSSAANTVEIQAANSSGTLQLDESNLAALRAQGIDTTQLQPGKMMFLHEKSTDPSKPDLLHVYIISPSGGLQPLSASNTGLAADSNRFVNTASSTIDEVIDSVLGRDEVDVQN